MTTVEGLLQEFYQPSTSNARKREIETNLLAFKSQPEAWQLCLRVATTSDINENQFLWFFSTSTLEHTITRRWTQLTSTDKTLLREALWNSYAQLGSTPNAAKRQRDTLAQLIALVGKREFPEQDPNYMQHCMELTKTRFQLGINLLRITSEEVVSNRGDLTTEWKQYFYSWWVNTSRMTATSKSYVLTLSSLHLLLYLNVFYICISYQKSLLWFVLVTLLILSINVLAFLEQILFFYLKPLFYHMRPIYMQLYARYECYP